MCQYSHEKLKLISRVKKYQESVISEVN
jgi:hypothetical protein